MKMCWRLYRICVCSCLVVLLCSLTACSYVLPQPETKRVVIDGLGRPISLPEKPQRVIALDIATSEISMLLVPYDRLIAVSYFMDDPGICNLSEEAQAISGRVERSVEHILSLEPDLVLVTSPGKDDLRTQLEDIGVPVFVIARPYSAEDIETNVRMLGDVLGNPVQAETLCRAMETDLGRIRAAIAQVKPERPQRILRISRIGPLGTKGSNVDAVIREAQCINVGADIGLGEGVLLQEILLQANIDMLLLPTWDFKGRDHLDELAEYYAQDPALQTVPAIQNRKFIHIPDYLLTAQTPHRIFATGELAARAYGITWESELMSLLPQSSIRQADWDNPAIGASIVYKEDI